MSVSSRNPMPGKHKGRLKIFLGYAAGVGKTYQMLSESRRLKEQGRDVVIGYFEPHGRQETIARTEGLESAPRKRFEHRGAVFEDMDTDAVIARHPEIVAVDEFAHSNVPGSARSKRWQDVILILDAGIDVLTSMNVQHIESLNDQVWQVTGIRVRETVPDWVVQDADEVVMVDVTPRALLHRFERGVVYSPEKARQALRNFFTESNLTALRELALRQAAHHLEEVKRENDRPTGKREKLLLWLTPHASTAVLIRRGRRVADFLGCPCAAIYLRKDEPAIEPWLNICQNLRIDAQPVDCKDNPANEISAYARLNKATQLYVTRNTPGVSRLVDLARDLQIIVVAERTRTNPA